MYGKVFLCTTTFQCIKLQVYSHLRISITFELQGKMSIGKQEKEVILEWVMLTPIDLQHNPRNCIEVGPLYAQSDAPLVQSPISIGLDDGFHEFGCKINEITILEYLFQTYIQMSSHLEGKICFIFHDTASLIGPQYQVVYGKRFGKIKLFTFSAHIQDLG